MMLRPALMLNGPWALGGRQIPINGNMYSPPMPEDRLSWPLTSPSWWGSKQTSTLVSDPAWKPGEAKTLLSTVKSRQSVCRREKTSKGSHNSSYITVIEVVLLFWNMNCSLWMETLFLQFEVIMLNKAKVSKWAPTVTPQTTCQVYLHLINPSCSVFSEWGMKKLEARSLFVLKG